jgi:hypothetical protein
MLTTKIFINILNNPIFYFRILLLIIPIYSLEAISCDSDIESDIGSDIDSENETPKKDKGKAIDTGSNEEISSITESNREIRPKSFFSDKDMVNGSNRTYHSPNEYINKNYTSMGD